LYPSRGWGWSGVRGQGVDAQGGGVCEGWAELKREPGGASLLVKVQNAQGEGGKSCLEKGALSKPSSQSSKHTSKTQIVVETIRLLYRRE
jgi:hypothetical protein